MEMTYEGLIWQEKPVWEGGQTKPTKEEVEAEVARLQQEWEATEYQRLRAVEYPDFKEYLDGIVKGDQPQMQAYIDKCLEVKEKYPKPE
jgi:tRNA A37 N6-isopentenylltransferase MiaA